MFTEMATYKQCSVCNKESGPMYCKGCDEYFCKKDFTTHREGILIQMDRIVEERNRLQNEINTVSPDSDQESSLIDQINKWRDITIEKVKQVAADIHQQAIQLLNPKHTKINTDFKSFSQELTHLEETEDYAEQDLTRLNQMISQFKQDLRRSTQPTTIKLYTEQIDWNRLIYVKEEPTNTKNQERQRQPTGKLIKYFP
jgi:chromosome segregation ATPase